MGTEETAPADNLTDAEFDLIIHALGMLGVIKPELWNESNRLHTKLLFNKWNYVKPNTATTHADKLPGDITDYSTYLTPTPYQEVSTRQRRTLSPEAGSNIEGSPELKTLEAPDDSL